MNTPRPTSSRTGIPNSAPDNVRPLRPHQPAPHTSVDRPSGPVVAAAVEERQTRWTAPELMATEFPPVRWAVPGVVAEGLTLLAGPPKLGKSWFSYGLAVAITTGGRALGAVDVEMGSVLYLALEDTGRRLQERLTTLLGDQQPPAGLTLETKCPKFHHGGEAVITDWLDANRDARLVIIDTLAKLQPNAAPGTPQYHADYAAMTIPKTIADTYGVAVLMVHHTRKLAADDPFDMISGTNGVFGAADAAIVLTRTRGTADGAMHVTGRDVEETERAMAFDEATGAWTILPGPAINYTLEETRAKVLQYVRDHPGSGPTAIANGTGVNLNNVKQTCRRMADNNQLRSLAGRYHAPDDDTATGNGENSSDSLGDRAPP